ncbi:FG-GAP repeat domain-containing protein [Fuerstiella marisgermanici]|uniref:FG-GAP repeat n=1 Tax=Fuerstiella marisgermanici TaxID=1891926 RepID=A0A1P8WLC8_9PLAN|nr:VCBS repeat-containing protein [Fuerstiella marisgermanici]APZ94857.1 FG-GAP repeat [Fuerstiella marisgermanici]
MQTTPPSLKFLSVVVVVAACVGSHRAAAFDDAVTENELAQFYGFSGVELYKLDGRAFSLVHADFDSDGLDDLVAVDNRASCLRLFRQQKEAEPGQGKTSRYVNDLASDWRFDVRQISVDKQVAGLVASDFNGDGRTDLAYVGVPDRLVIRYQPEKGKTEWTERWSVRLPDLAPAAWMIATGDLNNDKRADIAVLGKNATHVIFQEDDGSMKAPESLINTSAQLALVQIADLDGDGLQDLSYQANEGSDRGLCARLQTKDGRLGPEVRFDLNQPRSVTLFDVDKEPGKEILTVDSRTGRVQVSKLQHTKRQEDDLPARLVQYGIGAATGREKRAIAIGDIDGDMLSDVVVTDPENAQVLVYRQNGIDGLGTAETFPGLLGAIDVCIADLDGDQHAEVILMSDKESAIAVSRFKDGRLVFPEVVARPIDGHEFAAMTILRQKDKTLLAACMKKGSGSSASLKLRLLNTSGDESWTDAVDVQTLPPAAIGTRGMNLLSLDADGDAIDDLLAVPSGAGNKGVVLLPTAAEGAANGRWKVEPLNLGTASAGELFVHGRELYVAREAFARKMTFEEDEWKIADQFNAGESKARLAGVAVVDLDGEADPEVVLVDTGVKKLRVLRKNNGLYRPWKEVELGSLRFASAHVADLNGDQQDDLLLCGSQQFAVLYSGQANSELTEVATYESDRDDAYAADVIAGDINGDGNVDLAVIDTSIDGVEILRLDKDKGLQAATHFRVFEEKRLVSDSSARGTEPREGAIVDVTGDGRNDLILLCHDRLIVYPQDSGVDTGSSSTDSPSASE